MTPLLRTRAGPEQVYVWRRLPDRLLLHAHLLLHSPFWQPYPVSHSLPGRLPLLVSYPVSDALERDLSDVVCPLFFSSYFL